MKGWVVGLVVVLLLVGIGYFFRTQITGMFSGILSQKQSIADILKTPESYVGQTVTISGKFTSYPDTLTDDQGYKIQIDCQEPGRVIYQYSKYKATGTIMVNQRCTCERKDSYNLTSDEYDQVVSIVESANSNYGGIPYFKVSISKNDIVSLNNNWNEFFTTTESKVSDCERNPEISNATIAELPRFNEITAEKISEFRCKAGTIAPIYPPFLKCTEPILLIS